jgi:hypothetical protein
MKSQKVDIHSHNMDLLVPILGKLFGERIIISFNVLLLKMHKIMEDIYGKAP